MNFSDVKKLTLPEGEVTKITDSSGNVLWQAITFTNQVPLSTDTDGSIYNGVGYKDNVRLSSSGGISSSAQNGSVTTGFMPFPNGDKTVIRMKGVEWMEAYTKYGGHFYLYFYDSSKTKVNYLTSETYSGGSMNHVVTITRDSNGIETFTFSQTFGNTNAFLDDIRTKAKYFRINAYGKGANMIVTVDEEIE